MEKHEREVNGFQVTIPTGCSHVGREELRLENESRASRGMTTGING